MPELLRKTKASPLQLPTIPQPTVGILPDYRPLQPVKDEAAKRRQQMGQTLYDDRVAYSARTQDYRNTATFAATLRQDDPSKDMKYLDELRKSQKAGKRVDQNPQPTAKEQQAGPIVQDGDKKGQQDEGLSGFDDLFSMPPEHEEKGKEKKPQATGMIEEQVAEVAHEKAEKAKQAVVERKIRQLHVFVNIPGTPANRVVVFFDHMRGRTQPAQGQKMTKGSAVSIQRGDDQKLEIADLSTIDDDKLKTAPAEDKLKSRVVVGEKKEAKSKEEKADDMLELVEDGLKKYKSTLEKFVLPAMSGMEVDEKKRKYDEMVVIGVAHPDTKKRDGIYYKKYESLSGLTEIDEVAKQLNILANRCLKDDGVIRVQLCHAKSVGQEGKSTFVEQIMSGEEAARRNINISAPKSFSIVGSNGGVIDVTTHANVFDVELKGVLAKLMKDKDFKKSPIENKEEKILEKIRGTKSASQVNPEEVFYREPDQLRHRGMLEDI